MVPGGSTSIPPCAVPPMRISMSPQEGAVQVAPAGRQVCVISVHRMRRRRPVLVLSRLEGIEDVLNDVPVGVAITNRKHDVLRVH